MVISSNSKYTYHYGDNLVFTEYIDDTAFSFKTTGSVFSPKSIDKGTLAMLSVVELSSDDYILDLGCGYGVVGIILGKIEI